MLSYWNVRLVLHMLTTYPQNLEKFYIKYIQKQNNACHVKGIQQILTETLLEKIKLI